MNRLQVGHGRNDAYAQAYCAYLLLTCSFQPLTAVCGNAIICQERCRIALGQVLSLARQQP